MAETADIRERLERLLTAGLSIYQERTLEGVLQRVTDAARDVLRARYAALGVLNEDGTGLSAFVTSGLTADQRRRIGEPPRGRGLLGAVIREARPLRAPDIGEHPRHVGFPAHHPPMKTFLGSPIAILDRVFGNLYLCDKIDGTAFDAEDERITVLLAAQAATAIQNARLHEESAELLGQVRAMQRQRDLFSAMMNHELRNALTGVYGWAERLVRRRSADSATAAQEVFEGAERTIVLLNNFLDLTRLDAGKIQPLWRSVQLRTAVGRAIAGTLPAAEARGIVLEQQYEAEPADFTTDPVRLEQILVNLLSNAIRHSPERAAVVLRVRGGDTTVDIEVVDTGPGIPAGLRDKIFTPFERFDPQSGTGSGLGLALSRRLAEILGGSLDLESPPSGGAVFRLRLPHRPPGA